MPKRPGRPCSYPGCPAIVHGQHSKCEKHRREEWRQYNQGRPTVTQQGYGADWRKVRNAYMAEHPYCEECGAPAQMVDHRQPLREGGTNDPGNLRALCRTCHNTRHARDGQYFGGRARGGKGRQNR